MNSSWNKFCGLHTVPVLYMCVFYVCLSLKFQFIFKKGKKQKAGPAHQQAEVLQEKHETRFVSLHLAHLWKLQRRETYCKLKTKIMGIIVSYATLNVAFTVSASNNRCLLLFGR